MIARLNRHLIFILAPLLFLTLKQNSPATAATGSSTTAPTETLVKSSLEAVERIDGLEADEELVNIIPAFFTLPQRPTGDLVKDLFENKRLAQWSGYISEFTGMAEILFEGLPPAKQEANRSEHVRALYTIQQFQREIIRYVLAIHPGFTLLQLEDLVPRFSGRGVRVAVFDVFDRAQLERQRQLYPRATIRGPLTFGNPLEMSHGNSVIDIILRIAPEVEIIPFWSDAKSYGKAMLAIEKDRTIDVLNMSRALPEDPSSRSLDASFKLALRNFSADRIFVKALGNTGTDLFGTLNRRRRELGLGPVNNISSYDLKLIRDLYDDTQAGDPHLEILAANLSLFADEIALTATVPGGFRPVQERTIGVPAEGVYSPSTGTFESGSSFAAPQVVAVSALLLQARRALRPLEEMGDSRKAVYEQIMRNANRRGHREDEWGRGMLSGKAL